MWGSNLPHKWRASEGGGATYHICEEEARVGELEMLEEWVENHAVESTPGAVQILSGLKKMYKQNYVYGREEEFILYFTLGIFV